MACQSAFGGTRYENESKKAMTRIVVERWYYSKAEASDVIGATETGDPVPC